MQLTNRQIREHNRRAWDRQVAQGNVWTVPVQADDLERARCGELEIRLTPERTVPRGWYPPLPGARVLCLASGGGQQGPLLAAAGAKVLVLDNSPAQLLQDRSVAREHRLPLTTVQGDMCELDMFAGEAFDLIVHPCSNCFVPEVRSVWQGAFRVLRRGGVLLAGCTNPVRYLFDEQRSVSEPPVVRYSLPYTDEAHLPPDELQRRLDSGEPLEFSHTLEDLLGGQLEAGFVLTHFVEDRYPPQFADDLSRYLPTFLLTRAVKP